MLTDTIVCSISMKMFYLIKHSTQQLITLTISVNEANCLQSCICQLIAKKGHGIMILNLH